MKSESESERESKSERERERARARARGKNEALLPKIREKVGRGGFRNPPEHRKTEKG